MLGLLSFHQTKPADPVLLDECDVKSKEELRRDFPSRSDISPGIINISPQAHASPSAVVAHYQLQGKLSLTEQVTQFWSTDWESLSSKPISTLPGETKRRDENKSKSIKKLRGDAFEKLMASISACMPVARFKTKDDLDYCLEAIKTYIDRRNTGALEFVELVQTAAFEELHIRVRSTLFSIQNLILPLSYIDTQLFQCHDQGQNNEPSGPGHSRVW